MGALKTPRGVPRSGACVIVIGLVLGAQYGPALGTEPPTYDLSACIQTALRNSPNLAAAAAAVAAARARLEGARTKRYGRLEYDQQFGAVNGATGDILDPPKQNRNNILEDLGPFIKGSLDLNVPVWTFGKLSAALEAAEQGLESQRADSEAKRAEVILNVKRLYYGLLLAWQLSDVLHDMLGDLDKAIKKTQERLDAGSSTVTEIDLLKLKTGYAKFAKGVLDVDAASELTHAALGKAMGLASGEPFALADRRLQPAAVALAPQEQYLVDGPPRRPELRQLRNAIAAQSARVALEEASYFPTIFLSGGFRYGYAPNRTEQDNPFAYDNFNYRFPYVILGLHWDLSILQTAATLDEARATLAGLRAQERRAEDEMRLEIRKAYSDVERAQGAIKTSEEGRKAGRALLVLTVSNFDLGIGEAEELFKGLGTYTEMSTDYLRAVHDYNVAVAALSKAVGAELSALEYDGATSASEDQSPKRSQ